MKRFFLKSLTAFVLAFLIALPTTLYGNINPQPANELSVVIDGRQFFFHEQNPVIIENRGLAPLSLFEILGFHVYIESIIDVAEWEVINETVIISNANYTIRIRIGSNIININNVVHYLDVPAQIIGTNKLVPLGPVLANTGFGLNWDSNTRTVYITSPAAPLVEVFEEVNWEFFNNLAIEFINHTASGDFETAVLLFHEAMAEAIPAEYLHDIWEEVLSITGEFIEIYDIQNAEVQGFFVSGLILRHENTGFVWNVVFTEEGLIAGLNSGGFVPLDVPVITEPTAMEGFVEEPILIGENTNFPLRGILSIPIDAEFPVPAAIIVHGSGPSDLDGHMFGNRPYRDIAHFLAANGIAVIRNDKRTYAHPYRMQQEFGGSATVWHESIEDALLAAEMLTQDPRIDSNRIYIIGHSLGGILAPRIHAAIGEFAGLILMAATPRSLMELFIEQNTASVISGYGMGVIDEETKNIMLYQILTLEAELNAIAYLTKEEAKTTFIEPLGVWAYYLQDLETHTFADYIGLTDVPILVMQGGRDFQILPDVDFILIQELLESRDNTTFMLFDGLNHSFIPTEAANFVEHAAFMMHFPGVVYELVLQAIVDWITLE